MVEAGMPANRRLDMTRGRRRVAYVHTRGDGEMPDKGPGSKSKGKKEKGGSKAGGKKK
jgi:hypothetical protein